MSRLAVLLAAGSILAALSPLPARAQSCAPVLTRTAPDALSGRRIDSLRVVTLPPEPLPGPAAMIERLHVRTLEETVRRQLLFTAGDTIDTVRIAETMRRLRHRRYLADAWLEARPCGPNGGVAITLTTRDAWSTRPAVKLSASGSATVGLEERNLLGTGRAASLYLRSNRSRIGLGAMLSDPWVPHTPLAATLRVDSYRDGTQWLAQADSRRLSIFEPWFGQFVVMGSTYRGSGDTAGVFTRQWVNLLVAHVVAASPHGATSIVGGAELATSRLNAGLDDPLLGPPVVRRRFAGVDLGLRRESARYDTLTWLLPEQGFADVPRGFEWDAIVGLGRELEAGEPMVHIDLWGGRTWAVGARGLLVADLWSSGFIARGDWDAGTMRAHLSYFGAAPRGLWQVHLATEHLLDPDPDVRALATLDPAARLFPERSRLAELATTAWVERDVDLRPLSHSWALRGALFGSLSIRDDPTWPATEQLHAGVIGLGLRIAPRRGGRATFRIDLGVPVIRSPALHRGPFVGLLVVPWLGADRQRDGAPQS